uniref:Uncharacterized protein n=1 Tax=Molossus molossus TaxID=27622 RepID=A0A7J8DC08_MOLMO|nr:hypothetical protein HJG59_009372 [Molossus molossus]
MVPRGESKNPGGGEGGQCCQDNENSAESRSCSLRPAGKEKGMQWRSRRNGKHRRKAEGAEGEESDLSTAAERAGEQLCTTQCPEGWEMLLATVEPKAPSRHKGCRCPITLHWSVVLKDFLYHEPNWKNTVRGNSAGCEEFIEGPLFQTHEP